VGGVVDAPERAPAGVEQDGVARPHGQTVGRKGGLGVVWRDDVAWAEPVNTADGGDVEQQAAGHDLWQRVDAEPVGAVVVVGAVTDLQVVQPVQVGTHLLGRGHLLDDPVDAIATQPGWSGVWTPPVDLVVVRGEVLPERASRERRDRLVQHVRAVVHTAAPYQANGLDHLRRGDLVERAGLVVGAVPRRLPRVELFAVIMQLWLFFHSDHSDDQVVSKLG
jgi:hypothetical protein